MKKRNHAPGSFGCHEALHMASVCEDFVDRHLRQHPAIRANKAWRKEADKVLRILGDLYQAIGREHLGNGGDPA